MFGSVTAPAETPDVVKDSEQVIEPVRRAPILIAVDGPARRHFRPGTTALLAQSAMAREMRRQWPRS